MICNCLDGNASKIEPIKKATPKVWKYSQVILFVGFKFYGKKKTVMGNKDCVSKSCQVW